MRPAQRPVGAAGGVLHGRCVGRCPGRIPPAARADSTGSLTLLEALELGAEEDQRLQTEHAEGLRQEPQDLFLFLFELVAITL